MIRVRPISAKLKKLLAEQMLDVAAPNYNTFRPHSSLGYQTPAAYAGHIAATGSDAAQFESFAFPPVASTAPLGVSKTAEAPIAAG